MAGVGDRRMSRRMSVNLSGTAKAVVWFFGAEVLVVLALLMMVLLWLPQADDLVYVRFLINFIVLVILVFLATFFMMPADVDG
ncbi:hypothetical protein DIPPA_20861 [Diplonema papillatum]|nr:hypothetical protein DIPPA_20861 [Diplonema papillatum]